MASAGDSDSVSSAHNGSIDSEESEEESEVQSSSDEISETGDLDDGELAQLEYQSMIQDLRSNSLSVVEIHRSRLLNVILDNIDEFCEAVTAASEDPPTEASFGLEGRIYHTAGPIDVSSDEKAAAWLKFCRAIQGMESLKHIVVGYYIFGFDTMLQLLECLPANTKKLRVCIDCRQLLERDSQQRLDALVQAISSCQSEAVALTLYEGECGRPNGRPYLLGSKVSTLLAVPNLMDLCLREVYLSLDECNALSEYLTSPDCSLGTLRLIQCTYLDQGGTVVARALGQNRSVKEMTLIVSVDEQFHNALLQSLPTNGFIETLHVNVHSSFVPDFFKTLCLRNRNVKKLDLRPAGPTVSERSLCDVKVALRQNFSLENIALDMQVGTLSYRNFSHEILRLNKAGRRYLLDDAHSKSKCIAVLAKVKDDLDALYTHMRENPVLCVGYSKPMAAGAKRKAITDSTGETTTKKNKSTEGEAHNDTKSMCNVM